MGSVRLGPPKELMKQLHDNYNINLFVETGTYRGETANWASNWFGKVKTIELSDDLYDQALQKYGDNRNIEFIKGKSQEQLPTALDELDESAIFWLDAHYSGGGTAGQEYECPLLEELEAIGNSDQSHFIFIDDARLFLSPPPRPHSAEDWPTVSKVMNKITETIGKEYYIIIIEDVIVAVPPFAIDVVLNYAQDVITGKTNKTKYQRGLRQIKKGIRLVSQGFLENIATEQNTILLKKMGLYPIVRFVYKKIWNLLN